MRTSHAALCDGCLRGVATRQGTSFGRMPHGALVKPLRRGRQARRSSLLQPDDDVETIEVRSFQVGIELLIEAARRLEAGRRLERRPPPEQAYPAETLRAGERLVDRQADAVEGQAAEPARETVRRHDEGQRLGEMGSVVEKQPPFAERLADERDVALREVPHAAMHEFRGPTRRALGEVVSLDEQRGKPADGGIHGHA